MRINQLKILNKDEIQSIHDSSIELLESLGVKVESDEAIKLPKEHGATVDDKEKNTFVRFPESLATEQLKNVPDLSSNIEKQIAKYTQIVTSRSLEDYMKLQGIDNSKGSIDVAGVKIE